MAPLPFGYAPGIIYKMMRQLCTCNVAKLHVAYKPLLEKLIHFAVSTSRVCLLKYKRVNSDVVHQGESKSTYSRLCIV